MKILKILGIVAGVHALALLLIFANPGCSAAGAANPSSGDDAPAKPAAPPPAAASTPSVSVPPIVTASAVGDPALTAAPIPADTSSGSEPIRYSPTRPGTAVAEAIETQPVENVTPASTYTVARGDSLWTVAKKNHLTIAQLCSANKLKARSSIHVGQRLIIPGRSSGHAVAVAAVPALPAAARMPPTPAESGAANLAASRGDVQKHIVKPGETLGAIARLYHVRVGDIAQENSISDPKRIHPGQELIIPGRKAGSQPALDSKPPLSRTLIVGPAPDQDLDAGKPAASGDVPVIRVDDGSGSAPAH